MLINRRYYIIETWHFIIEKPYFIIEKVYFIIEMSRFIIEMSHFIIEKPYFIIEMLYFIIEMPYFNTNYFEISQIWSLTLQSFSDEAAIRVFNSLLAMMEKTKKLMPVYFIWLR